MYGDVVEHAIWDGRWVRFGVRSLREVRSWNALNRVIGFAVLSGVRRTSLAARFIVSRDQNLKKEQVLGLLSAASPFVDSA